MAQYARPDADDATGNWTANGGPSTLYECIDEESASDSDYMAGDDTATTADISLSAVTDPSSSSGHIVRWRWNSTGSGAFERLTIQLRDSSGLIATCANNAAVDRSWTDKSYDLSAGEADTITDYSDLFLRFGINSVGTGEEIQISWAELEVPDAGGAAAPLLLAMLGVG